MITFLSIFSFSWVIIILLGLTKLSGIYITLLSYSLAIVINGLFEKSVKKNHRYFIYGILSLINLLIFLAPQKIVNILLFSGLFALSKSMIIDVQTKIAVKDIRVSELKPYNKLAMPIYSQGKISYDKGRILDSSDIRIIKKMFKNDKKISVKESFGLAPFIFLSSLITIAIKGEIVTWILSFFR